MWLRHFNNASSDEGIDYQYFKEFSPTIIKLFWRYKCKFLTYIINIL